MAAATGQLIRARQGDPIKKTIELRDSGGNLLVDTFGGAEVLTVRLWAGDDRSLVAPAPVATWDDAPNALVNLDGDGSETANLDRGVYKLEVLADGEPVWAGGLEVLAAPGDAAVLATYATYDGMLRLAGSWIKRLKDEASQASFVEERHDAFLWTHRQVISRARSLLADRSRGYHGNADAGALIEATNGLDETTTDARLAWLAGRLSDSGLITTPTIVDANEHYAVSIALGRMMGNDAGQTEHYWRLAAMHRARANAMLSAVTFRIDAGDSEVEGEPGTVLTLGPG